MSSSPTFRHEGLHQVQRRLRRRDQGSQLDHLQGQDREHRLLTGVYYILALRNSIISIGQLDENGSRVEIEDGVLRIWDRSRRLLAKVNWGSNHLYVLHVQMAQPLYLVVHQDDEAWRWHERFGHLHFGP
jgi:hypothetical protein